MGHQRPGIWILRHLATRREHVHDAGHVPDGLPHPHTQNRDAKATQLKLDELIRSIGDAREQFIGAEAEPEERIERETREVEAEKDTPAPPAAADDRRVDPPSHNGKPHNGEPAGQR